MLTMIQERADALREKTENTPYKDEKKIIVDGMELTEVRHITIGISNSTVSARTYKDKEKTIPHGTWRYFRNGGLLDCDIKYENGVLVSMKNWYVNVPDYPYEAARQTVDVQSRWTESIETTITDEFRIPVRCEKHYNNGGHLLATRFYTADNKPYGMWMQKQMFTNAPVEIYHIDGDLKYIKSYGEYQDWFKLTHYQDNKPVLSEDYSKDAKIPNRKHFYEADVYLDFDYHNPVPDQPKQIRNYGKKSLQEIIELCKLDTAFTGKYSEYDREWAKIKNYGQKLNVIYANGMKNGEEEIYDIDKNCVQSLNCVNDLYEGRGYTYDPETKTKTWTTYHKGKKHGVQQILRNLDTDEEAWDDQDKYYWHDQELPKKMFMLLDGAASLCKKIMPERPVQEAVPDRKPVTLQKLEF
jgi:hypothetical protein